MLGNHGSGKFSEAQVHPTTEWQGWDQGLSPGLTLSGGCGPQASSISTTSTPGSVFKMQILGPQPVSTESEALGMGPSNLYFCKRSKRCQCKVKFWTTVLEAFSLHNLVRRGGQCSSRHRREPNCDGCAVSYFFQPLQWPCRLGVIILILLWGNWSWGWLGSLLKVPIPVSVREAIYTWVCLIP